MNFNPTRCDKPFTMVPPFSRGTPCVKACAGDGFSVALSYDGIVYCTGKGSFGRLGQEHLYDLSDMTRV